MNYQRAMHTIIIFLLAFSFCYSQDNSEQQLYFEGKKHCINTEWDKAIELLQQLIDEYPNSKYQDDARFWIGYCFEKKPEHQVDAFMAFENLVSMFPNSTWADDAIIHQISVSENLVRQNQEQYREFLIKKLNSDEIEIRGSAALALGRLQDERAIPVLKELQYDEVLGSSAKAVINQIESGTVDPPQPVEEQKDVSFATATDIDRIEKKDKKGDFFLYKTKRYTQYRSMLKVREDWSKDELIDFAMWQILPTNEFEEYHSLQGYDRREWLRKFWKLRDPTPTTEQNEAEIEFEKRINHSRAHFAEHWNYKNFRFRRDQVLAEDWPHAPWDARGELYIKYGEPDFVEITDYRQEQWTYYWLSADFEVAKNITNIYGDAIRTGTLSRKIHPARIEIEHLYNEEFIYNYDYGAKHFKGFKQTIEFVDGAENKVLVNYTLPAKEFDRQNNAIKYSERYVVFDEDMREVLNREAIQEISDPKDNIHGLIEISLDSGKYMIALRIANSDANKLGIYWKDFEVEAN